MINRLRRSRGARKFVRNKLAVVAMGVIGFYALIALFALFGGINLQSTQERVLPDKSPGWLESISPERRAAEMLTRYEQLQRTMERAQRSEEFPRRVLDEQSWAERRIADLPIEELAEILASAEDAFYDADESFDELQYLEGEIHKIEDDLAAGEIAEEDRADAEAELADLRAEATEIGEFAFEALDTLETAMLQFQPMPTGFDGFKYKLRTLLGSDDKGASILIKTVYGTKVAFQIGFVTAVVSVLIGSLLGAAAAFFGGWVDGAVMWIVSTLSSIPYLILLAVLVFMFTGSMFDDQQRPALALVPVYAAFCLTFWIGTCRIIRGEVMKIKELEYVQAATAIGFGRFYILLKHVIPNTTHIMFINFSLLFIGAIKSEVILSFLGFGVKGQPSWGVMISHAKTHVTSFFFWEVLSATVFMVGLVLAFNIVSDALQDAFDPKHVG